MREDASILFSNAVKVGLSDELNNAFKSFQQNGKSSILLSKVVGASEEMVQAFYEKNFSNPEIGALYNLRRSRSGPYHKAFEKFDKDGNLESLVAQLKRVIEDESFDGNLEN